MQSNGYPKRFILDAIKPTPPLKNITTGAQSERGYSTIPYVRGTSEPIKSFGKPRHQSGIQTLSDYNPDVSKTQLEDETRDPVYDIPCAHCSKSYIGETQRKFITRKVEHQKAVARRQGEKSALADHAIKKQITISHGMRLEFSGLIIISITQPVD